ncbi:hypothetical protein OC835_007895, partial [Tilletia horrida]
DEDDDEDEDEDEHSSDGSDPSPTKRKGKAQTSKRPLGTLPPGWNKKMVEKYGYVPNDEMIESDDEPDPSDGGPSRERTISEETPLTPDPKTKRPVAKRKVARPLSPEDGAAPPLKKSRK